MQPSISMTRIGSTASSGNPLVFTYIKAQITNRFSLKA